MRLHIQENFKKFDYIMQCYRKGEMDEETALIGYLPYKGDTFNVFVQFIDDIDKYPRLIGYFGDGSYDDYTSTPLKADDIENCNLSAYMNGYDIIDLEGMLRDNPEMFYINNNDLDESCSMKETSKTWNADTAAKQSADAALKNIEQGIEDFEVEINTKLDRPNFWKKFRKEMTENGLDFEIKEKDTEWNDHYYYMYLYKLNVEESCSKGLTIKEEEDSTRLDDINFIMYKYVHNHHGIRIVGDGKNGDFQVNYNGETVTVSFDVDDTGYYVYTINDEGPHVHHSYEYIASDIINFIDAMLDESLCRESISSNVRNKLTTLNLSFEGLADFVDSFSERVSTKTICKQLMKKFKFTYEEAKWILEEWFAVSDLDESYQNGPKGPNYLMTKLKDGSWEKDSERGVQYVVVNNLTTLDRDCAGFINVLKGINNEHTIYEWGIDGRYEKWTEIDSSNPDYKYLSQYLDN